MRIYFKRSTLLLIGFICFLLGIFVWNGWQKYKLKNNHFTHPTPKTNLNYLEEAILMDSHLISKCQHFAQGKQSLIVDSKGYLCERRHLDKATGCCQTETPSILGPYICDTCSSTTHCCSSFENCISCCLQPDHRNYLQSYIRSRDLKTKLLLSHLSTSFDLCVSRCRTHSNSENSNYFPFNVQWLDSSYQQTCLPDSPWQKVLDDLEPALANKTYQQFDNPQRRQIIIELLGPQFQLKYFRFEPDIPHILLPPSMSEEDRHQLENEAKSWLQIQALKVAIDVRAAVTEDGDINRLSMNMQNFLEYTYEIVSKSLERHLYQNEQKQEIHKKKYKNQFTGQAKFRSMLRDAKTNSKKLPMISEISSISGSMTSKYSNTIADSIIALLKRDLRRVIIIKEKLFGQQLPMILRQFIWLECLFRFENTSFDSDLNVVEYQIRRDFAAGILRGKNQLNIDNPLISPITNLIENDVIETYSKAHTLDSYLNEHHLRVAIKILNVLYTHNKIYKPYFIYWLLPFQLSFNDEVNKDEEIYVLAMHLHLFISRYYPSWTQIFGMTNRIMMDLSVNDPEFHHHLKTISKIRAKIDPKDFIPEILSLEPKQSIQYPPDPVLFLRKWISQMFVGIVHSNAVLFLWDQFFMTKWDIDYLEYAIKTVFYLLRTRFMSAKDYTDMRKVFLTEPGLLYTKDIQKAFVQLVLKNEDSKYISTINRRVYPLKPIVSNKYKIDSTLIGVKNISLSLIMPIRKDPRQEFQYKTLIVEIQVYDGREMFDSISTKTIPIIRKKEQSDNDWQKLTIDIPHEKLILSVRKTRPSFLTTSIQALVIIHQQLNVATLKTIAYCRFPLYIPRKIGNLPTWDVTYGLIERRLHPGIPPFSIDMIPDIPRAFLADNEHLRQQEEAEKD